MIYDITRTISTITHVWPGDNPVQISHVLQLEQGDSVNLTTISMSPHTGTHADAYYHYETNGEYPSQLPMGVYIGKAQVVTVDKEDGPLTRDDFAHVILDDSERLLIHSHVSDLPDNEWAQTFPYLSVELIIWLAGKNIKLIGLDSPSVDAFDSTDLPSHHALFRHKMVNLECLQLRGVPDGLYELIALPLKLDGVCGSPVRAILRTLHN